MMSSFLNKPYTVVQKEWKLLSKVEQRLLFLFPFLDWISASSHSDGRSNDMAISRLDLLANEQQTLLPNTLVFSIRSLEFGS